MKFAYVALLAVAAAGDCTDDSDCTTADWCCVGGAADDAGTCTDNTSDNQTCTPASSDSAKTLAAATLAIAAALY